jgi:cardiolipin synthase
MSPRFSLADALTVLRIPLAVVFVLVPSPAVRLTVLVLAAVSDFSDGVVARRFGASVVLFSGALAWYEVGLVLVRDLVASVAVFISLGAGRTTTVPARLGGKAVTLLQLLTLLAFLLESPHLRSLAWATGAVALYALWDYNRLFFRKLEPR